jgi:hypothetical protein
MLCQECKKKPTCKKLCERAEKWINQDYISQREWIFPHVRDRRKANLNLPLDNIYQHTKAPHQIDEITSFLNSIEISLVLTPLQNKCIHLFYIDGFSYKQIAFRLSNQYHQHSSRQIKYQIHLAKRRIVSFFSKNVRGKENIYE